MSDKTLPPTQKRLEKARREGQVGKSPFLTQICTLTVGLLTLIVVMRAAWLSPKIIVERIYDHGFEAPAQTLKGVIAGALFISGMFIIPSAVIGIAIESAQLGWRVMFGSGFNKSGKLSLVSGIKRMWSGIGTLWLPLILCASLCLVSYQFFIQSAPTLIMMIRKGFILSAFDLIWHGAKMLCAWAICAGLIDYWVRSRQHSKTLLMDHDELKRENRESEGDPLIRAQRKALHQTLIMQDLERRVRRASCVIVERTRRQI